MSPEESREEQGNNDGKCRCRADAEVCVVRAPEGGEGAQCKAAAAAPCELAAPIFRKHCFRVAQQEGARQQGEAHVRVVQAGVGFPRERGCRHGEDRRDQSAEHAGARAESSSHEDVHGDRGERGEKRSEPVDHTVRRDAGDPGEQLIDSCAEDRKAHDDVAFLAGRIGRDVRVVAAAVAQRVFGEVARREVLGQAAVEVGIHLGEVRQAVFGAVLIARARVREQYRKRQRVQQDGHKHDQRADGDVARYTDVPCCRHCSSPPFPVLIFSSHLSILRGMCILVNPRRCRRPGDTIRHSMVNM